MSQGRRSLGVLSVIFAHVKFRSSPHLSGFLYFMWCMLVCSLMPGTVGPAVVHLGHCETTCFLASSAAWIIFLVVREWQPQKGGTVVLS